MAKTKRQKILSRIRRESKKPRRFTCSADVLQRYKHAISYAALEQAIDRAIQASKDAQAAMKVLDAVKELEPPEMFSYDNLELIREDLEERARRLSNEIGAVTREDHNLMMRHRWLVERNAPPGDDFGEFLRRRRELIERSAMASLELRDAIDSVLLRQRDCFFDFNNWCIDEYKKNEQRTRRLK